MYGAHKWLGGAVCESNKCIYGVPSHSPYVLKIDPFHNQVMLLREGNGEGIKGKFKWLRGIYHGIDDSIIGIPANATNVLRIDAKTDKIELYGEGQWEQARGWLWHGAALAKDNNIYSIPANAKQVIFYDFHGVYLMTCTLTSLEISSTVDGRSLKWIQ